MPVLLWAGLLFSLSSLSHPPAPHFRFSDKLLHLGFYAIFGLLFVRAFRPGAKRWGWRRILLVGLLGGLGYGMTDEFHQLFVSDRSAEVPDLLMDGLGGLVGGVLFLILSAMTIPPSRLSGAPSRPP